MSRPTDWFSTQYNMPDVYRHGAGTVAPVMPGTGSLPPPSLDPGIVSDPVVASLTPAGGRPEVYWRGINTTQSVGLTPVPVLPGRISVDVIIVDVVSTALNSVFFGFGSGVSTVSGLEVRPGTPLIFQPDNTREQWELQRALEYFAAITGINSGYGPLPVYKAPRVVLDPSSYFLVAGVAGPTAVNLMLMYVPEGQ